MSAVAGTPSPTSRRKTLVPGQVYAACAAAGVEGVVRVGDGDREDAGVDPGGRGAWRSGSDGTLFEELLRDDPLVLLLADLPARPAANRARVVEAVFSLVHRDDTDVDHTALHRVDHPELPSKSER